MENAALFIVCRWNLLGRKNLRLWWWYSELVIEISKLIKQLLELLFASSWRILILQSLLLFANIRISNLFSLHYPI